MDNRGRRIATGLVGYSAANRLCGAVLAIAALWAAIAWAARLP